MKKIFLLSLSTYLLVSCSVQHSPATASQANPPWAQKMISGYKKMQQEPNLEVAQLLYEAAEAMPKKNWEAYLLAATVYAQLGNITSAFTATEKAIQAGGHDIDLLENLPPLAPLRADARWEQIMARAVREREAMQVTIQDPALLIFLQQLWAADQKAIADYEAEKTALGKNFTYEKHQALFGSVTDIWSSNQHQLDSIINLKGWPGYQLVGEEGAKTAWAIAQHAPDVFFKQKCLSEIRNSLNRQDVDPNHYAELHDRMARDTWQKQRYGASMGEKAPHPIYRPDLVDQRRRELGLLEPIELYALYHGINYQRPSRQAAPKASMAARQQAKSYYRRFEDFHAQTEIDSARLYLSRAIAQHGELSNRLLLKAAKKLAQWEDHQSQQLSLDILQVLVWRRWKGRWTIPKLEALTPLHGRERWAKILNYLRLSHPKLSR